MAGCWAVKGLWPILWRARVGAEPGAGAFLWIIVQQMYAICKVRQQNNIQGDFKPFVEK